MKLHDTAWLPDVLADYLKAIDFLELEGRYYISIDSHLLYLSRILRDHQIEHRLKAYTWDVRGYDTRIQERQGALFPVESLEIEIETRHVLEIGSYQIWTPTHMQFLSSFENEKAHQLFHSMPTIFSVQQIEDKGFKEVGEKALNACFSTQHYYFKSFQDFIVPRLIGEIERQCLQENLDHASKQTKTIRI